MSKEHGDNFSYWDVHLRSVMRNVLRILLMFCGFGFIAAFLCKCKIFNYPMNLALWSTTLTVFAIVILWIMYKKNVSPKLFMYLSAFVFQLGIFMFSFDTQNLHLTVTYMAPAIVSVLYFNPAFTLQLCGLSAVSMVLGICVGAENVTSNYLPGITPFYYILTTGGGQVAEFLFITAVLYLICSVSRRYITLLQKKQEEIAAMHNQVIASFSEFIESRDDVTGTHIKTTQKIVSLIVEYIEKNLGGGQKLSPKELAMLAYAAPLHDIGKIAIPDAILQKPAKLSDEEFAIMQRHTLHGEDLILKTLKGIEDDDFISVAAAVARYHHEKWDGSGYPDGLKGDEIPASARIMAVADVLDALCRKRPYKPSLSIDTAFGIMHQHSGVYFDPQLLEILDELRPQIEEIYSESTRQPCE